MDSQCAEALKREFGYAPDEDEGEKWVVYEDRTLIVIHPERKGRMYRRGAFDANDYCEFLPPW